MSFTAWKVALLLCGSGAAALVYQVTWMREFRTIFGSSTSATAAVVALFIGGLGLGSAVLGARVDKSANPLRLYACFEIGIALSSAASPLLLWFIKWIYLSLGGTSTLGDVGATTFRLLLASLVLFPPTFLMGGTLPAAARAIQTQQDKTRRAVALLYGLNTIGGVIGCLVANFWLLQTLGNHQTLWSACLLNMVVAILAGLFSSIRQYDQSSDITQPNRSDALAPPALVLLAAAVVGFAFMLLELVWYRMLGPLLGGTLFSFGLILAFALLGIGLGGTMYWAQKKSLRASLFALCVTCLLEALFVLLPWVAGDTLASWVLFLQPSGPVEFVDKILIWSAITSVVVLPPALMAGYQFPLLIALLGKGRQAVGRQVGRAYAANTAGAIIGSLAGGFGFLPWLSAPGSWLLVAVLLAALGVLIVWVNWHRDRNRFQLGVSGFLLVSVLVATQAQGPTAFWRHSPIGAGRLQESDYATPNRLTNTQYAWRRALKWEVDGVESSVGVTIQDGLAFVLNGKIDGNAFELGTGIMSGLIGALLHPRLSRALVIGLGTGTTCGWLGALPTIEAVDVVELEPAIIKVAQECQAVNLDALSNPKIHIHIGDAREVLQTANIGYDFIFSEPSNPYRVGVASLFSKEFYQAAAQRLNQGGIFAQWIQAYEVDEQTIYTIYATLHTVFPQIQTWFTQLGDLYLLASQDTKPIDASQLRSRLQQSPFKEGLQHAWRVNSLEGFLAHHLANSQLAKLLTQKQQGRINTDDKNRVEFGFARALGKTTGFDLIKFFSMASDHKADRPQLVRGQIDWNRVSYLRALFMAQESREKDRLLQQLNDKEAQERLQAFVAYRDGKTDKILYHWHLQTQAPTNPLELEMIAFGLAAAADDKTYDLLKQFSNGSIDKNLILARLAFHQHRLRDATNLLLAAFEQSRINPWVCPRLLLRSLKLARHLGALEPATIALFVDRLKLPFAAYLLEEKRLTTRVHLLQQTPENPMCIEALAGFEPYPIWKKTYLLFRLKCYEQHKHPLTEQAKSDLIEYEAQQVGSAKKSRS